MFELDALLALGSVESSFNDIVPFLEPFSGFLLILLLIGLLAFGVPLYVLLGLVTAYLLLTLPPENALNKASVALLPLIEKTRDVVDKEELLAIPFFVLAGALMTAGDIAKRLINIAREAFGWLPGGLGISAVMACIFFAAISGSSPVTVIAIGSMMYPVLLEENYSEKFSSGLLTSAGSLGILIPPSIPMLLFSIVYANSMSSTGGWSGNIPFNIDGTAPAYGVMIGADGSVMDPITALFMAGVGPGLFIGLVFSVYAFVEGKRRKVRTTPFNFRRFAKAVVDGFWALMLPVILLGGIYSGIFTVTPAAGVAVVYSFLVETLIHGNLKLRDLPKIFSESAVLMGTLLIIITMALGFNAYLVDARIPEMAVDTIRSYEMSRTTFLIVLTVLLLIVGCLMDIMSAILILVPLLAPLASELGIHPVHLGIIFIVNLEIGYLTPPLGLNLFVASTIFNKSIGEIIAGVLPFTLLLLLSLVFITFVPAISLAPLAIKQGINPFTLMTFPDTISPADMKKRKGAATAQSTQEVFSLGAAAQKIPKNERADLETKLGILDSADQKARVIDQYIHLKGDLFDKLANLMIFMDEEEYGDFIGDGVGEPAFATLVTALKALTPEERALFFGVLDGLSDSDLRDRVEAIDEASDPKTAPKLVTEADRALLNGAAAVPTPGPISEPGDALVIPDSVPEAQRDAVKRRLEKSPLAMAQRNRLLALFSALGGPVFLETVELTEALGAPNVDPFIAPGGQLERLLARRGAAGDDAFGAPNVGVMVRLVARRAGLGDETFGALLGGLGDLDAEERVIFFKLLDTFDDATIKARVEAEELVKEGDEDLVPTDEDKSGQAPTPPEPEKKVELPDAVPEEAREQLIKRLGATDMDVGQQTRVASLYPALGADLFSASLDLIGMLDEEEISGFVRPGGSLDRLITRRAGLGDESFGALLTAMASMAMDAETRATFMGQLDSLDDAALKARVEADELVPEE